jgi:AraC family transcriptional regulator
MKKKETSLLHSKIANEMMNYINTYIDTDININQMAQEFNISKFHFHRIFKEQMGENIYECIKSIRLQKASNLLITNESSTISKIASLCGYSSQTSFIRSCNLSLLDFLSLLFIVIYFIYYLRFPFLNLFFFENMI